MSSSPQLVLVDEPMPGVRRLTLNRPDKHNAMNNDMRRELFDHMRAADGDRTIAVVVIRGAGPSFSAGYDLSEERVATERSARRSRGWWSRVVVANWLEMSEMQVVFVAQVHGNCLGGGSELAAACDLAYVSSDAAIGYPPTRRIASPAMTWQPWLLGWRHGMEAVLTGSTMSGEEAARLGFANRAVADTELEATVLEVCARLADVPGELLAHNKRVMHRYLDASGVRSAIRWASDMQPVALGTAESRSFTKDMGSEKGLRSVIDEMQQRDQGT